MASEFARTYPNRSGWIRNQGWLEIGGDSVSRSLVRVLDEGGSVWEGSDAEATVDDVLRAANATVEQ